MAMSVDIFGCHTEGMLLASNGQRPGILLKSYNAQDNPTAKNYPTQNVNCVKVEKPFSIIIKSKREVQEY